MVQTAQWWAQPSDGDDDNRLIAINPILVDPAFAACPADCLIRDMCGPIQFSWRV